MSSYLIAPNSVLQRAAHAALHLCANRLPAALLPLCLLGVKFSVARRSALCCQQQPRSELAAVSSQGRLTLTGCATRLPAERSAGRACCRMLLLLLLPPLLC